MFLTHQYKLVKLHIKFKLQKNRHAQNDDFQIWLFTKKDELKLKRVRLDFKKIKLYLTKQSVIFKEKVSSLRKAIKFACCATLTFSSLCAEFDDLNLSCWKSKNKFGYLEFKFINSNLYVTCKNVSFSEKNTILNRFFYNVFKKCTKFNF